MSSAVGNDHLVLELAEGESAGIELFAARRDENALRSTVGAPSPPHHDDDHSRHDRQHGALDEMVTNWILSKKSYPLAPMAGEVLKIFFGGVLER